MNFNDIPGNLSIPAGYTLRTNATNDGFEVVDTSIFNDGDKGDIVVSSSGTVWTIDSGAVSDSKIASGITASKITQTSSYRFVTDAEKSTWNGKQDLLVSATNIKTINGTSLLGSGDITVSGAVTDGDKGDITVSGTGTVWTIDSGAVDDGKIASGITASKITQTSSYRFVTDVEKSTWNGKVDSNVAITGATKTKITYDAKGLITSATDATTADINDSTDKRYVTDAQLTVISNTSGTNTGDQTLNSLLPSQTGNSGKILKTDGSNSSWSDNYGTFGITIDGAGNVITTGFKQFLVVPYNCIITEWHIIANTSGSCVIDVWKDTTIPTVIDSITGTEKPTLSSQQTNNDTTLSTWTTTVNANDIIGFNVDSISGLTKITLVIKVRKI